MREMLYHNKFTWLYDYFQKGVKGDARFYLSYFKNFKGKILEIGAGTGRITIPLAKREVNITALDISPQMLKALKVKAKKENIKIKTICADMRSFKLREKFDAVIITYRTFQHMYSVDDQIKALKNIKKHLKPNGLLIFDVYNPNLNYIQKGNWQWRKDSTIKLLDAKQEVKIYYRNRYDMGEQMMYQEFLIKHSNGRKNIAFLKMRFFFRFEIDHLLRLTGFKVKNLYGDFLKNKFRNNSSEMVWLAKPHNKK